MGFSFSDIPGVSVVKNLYDQTTGKGDYNAHSDFSKLDQDTEDARRLRNQFASQFSNFQGTNAPGISAATIDTTQGNQARGVQGQGFGVQQQGVGVQQQGIGTQQQGIGVQQGSLGVQQGSLGAQGAASGIVGQGVGAAGAGLDAQRAAARSYQDVLSGNAPSVAELSARRAAGENVAAMYGGAASARGGDRAMALRAAINGAGGAGAKLAADMGIQRAAEMDAARGGLAGVGAGMAGTGATLGGLGGTQSNIGSATAATGRGIAETGQGITAGGQGISATGAGIAQSGQGLTAGGTQMRSQDLSSATDQATLQQQADLANQKAQIDVHGQDVTQKLGLGSLANTATQNELGPTEAKITQQAADKQNQIKNNSFGISTLGDIGGELFSDRRAKTSVTPDPVETRRMFTAILPASWKYKDGVDAPVTEGDRHLGVMAQDLEATKLGKGMVKTKGGLKTIDIPMAVSALMAAMADMQRREAGKRRAA